MKSKKYSNVNVKLEIKKLIDDSMVSEEAEDFSNSHRNPFLFPKTHQIDQLQNMGKEYQTGSLHPSASAKYLPATPGRNTNRLAKNKSLNNIKLKSLNTTSGETDRETEGMMETSEEDFKASPFRSKLESMKNLINPISRSDRNEMLFHDVFLMDEKEKLHQQINKIGILNKNVMMQSTSKKKDSINFEKEKLYFYKKEERKLDTGRALKAANLNEKIDDSMLRELILINSYDMKESEQGSKVKSQLLKTQSLKDLEMVVGVNLHLEKSSKETHLLIKLAVCREENGKQADSIGIWKKLLDIAKANKDSQLVGLALNHLAVNHFRKKQQEESQQQCLQHLEVSSEHDLFSVWYNTAVVQRQLNQPGKSIEQIRKAHQWALSNHDYYWQCFIYLQWGMALAYHPESRGESQSHFESALKILENDLQEHILHLKTLDLIGSVFQQWQEQKTSSTQINLTLKLQMESDNLQYDDRYDNDLRVRAAISELETRQPQLHGLIDNVMYQRVQEREGKQRFLESHEDEQELEETKQCDCQNKEDNSLD